MSATPSDSKASARKRGLGMGLSVLLGSDADPIAASGSGQVSATRTVPIELLHPSPLQPRRQFDEDELQGLADSIRQRGLMQPLLVRRAAHSGTHYEIVAGERRWRAAQLAGLHELPVILRELSDRDTLEVALLENVQRQDLSPLEEAEGYQRLISDFGHSQEELAGAIGKSRSHIANLLRLLNLPSPVRAMLEQGEISAGHARALLMAPNPLALAQEVVARGLNVRQTEALVRVSQAKPSRLSSGPVPRDPDTIALERRLSSHLGLNVSLKAQGKGGTLLIKYRTLDQLDNVIKRLV